MAGRRAKLPWLNAVAAGVLTVVAVPWLAGPAIDDAVATNWTAWAQAGEVPEQGYAPSSDTSGISGSNPSQADAPPPPPRPAKPAKPNRPGRPWPTTPIVTYRTPVTPTPTPRPSTVTLVASAPRPITPAPGVFEQTQVCLPLYGPGVPVPINATAGPGTVRLTWWHNGDRRALAYWVGVQPLAGTAAQRSAVTWVHVVPPTGCHDVVYTVPGLTSGAAYSFWLDLESGTPETAATVTRRTLNRVTRVVVG